MKNQYNTFLLQLKKGSLKQSVRFRYEHSWELVYLYLFEVTRSWYNIIKALSFGQKKSFELYFLSIIYLLHTALGYFHKIFRFDVLSITYSHGILKYYIWTKNKENFLQVKSNYFTEVRKNSLHLRTKWKSMESSKFYSFHHLYQLMQSRFLSGLDCSESLHFNLD